MELRVQLVGPGTADYADANPPYGRAITSRMDERAHDDGGGERIAKVIARAGLASRREAEKWIAAGRVSVNGVVIGSPAVDVTMDDSVAVDGQALPARERTRLFLFHKPRGLLTSHGDPRGRATIFGGLPKHLPRLISVGRLDLNTEGLLLLTNDGSLARVLELPSTGWLRRYRVRAHGRVTQEALDRLRGGITIDGIRYGPIEATADRAQGSNVWLTFAIREGKNREVKNVLGHLGLAVNRLIRVSFGPFQLSELAPGEIEEVRTRTLREQLGPRLAALTAADFSAPRVERTIGRRSVPRSAPHPNPLPAEEAGRGSPGRSAPPKAKRARSSGAGTAGAVGSLPPCGGGLGRGVTRFAKAGEFISPPPPLTPPHKGEGNTSGRPHGQSTNRGGNKKDRRKDRKKDRSGGFGPVGEPERARAEKRRRRAARSKRR
jgi:23S rRNA pseudouridine2605 synthase